MSTESQTKKGFPWGIILLGAVLMVGGFWVSKNVHLEFLDALAKQGIPLDPGKTVSTIGVFMVLFPVINFFYLTPLRDAIQERTRTLESTFAEAESLREQMSTMRTDYEKRLAETEASAREQIQAQIREAQVLRQQLMAEATAKADELVKKAQEEIQLERDRVMTQLRLEVVNLTMAATERVLGENIDDARNRKLVEEFIEKVEVPS